MIRSGLVESHKEEAEEGTFKFLSKKMIISKELNNEIEWAFNISRCTEWIKDLGLRSRWLFSRILEYFWSDVVFWGNWGLFNQVVQICVLCKNHWIHFHFNNFPCWQNPFLIPHTPLINHIKSFLTHLINFSLICILVNIVFSFSQCTV